MVRRGWALVVAASLSVGACSALYGEGDSVDTRDAGGDDAAAPDGAEAADAADAAAECDPATTDFTSDPNNCGGCGVTCGAGASCLAGTCRCGTGGARCEQTKPAGCDAGPCVGETVGECRGVVCKTRLTLATTLDVQQIVVGSSNIYFADRGADMIGKVPIDGGAVTSFASAGQPRGVALGSTNVFWTDTDNGAIMACPVAGCDGAPKAIFTKSGSSPISVAAHDGHVAWLDFGALYTCTMPDCADVVSTGVGGVGRFATTATSFYFTVNVRGAVLELPYGGVPRDLVTGELQPFAVAVTTSRLFWVSTNAIEGVPLDAGGGGDAGDAGLAAEPFVSGTFGDGSNHPTALAADGSFLYWTTPQGVVRCPLSGCSGAPEIIDTTPAGWGLAVDDRYVYLAGTGAIYRVDK